MSGREGATETRRLLDALRAGLADEGWLESGSLVVAVRFEAVDAASAARAASDLLALAPDAVLANTNIVTEEVLRLTRSIPVVFMTVGDPIDAGFVASYAHPGSNATGFTDFEPSHTGKWLGFLRETFPDLERVGLLFNPSSAPRNGWFYLTAFMTDALAMGIEPLAIRIRSRAEIESAVAVQADLPGTGLIVAPDAFTMVNREPILAAINDNRLPAIYPYSTYAEEGGLISYAVDMADVFRRGGAYLGRILNGEGPMSLPVQAPSRFELVVNLAAATHLGVTFPPALLVSADRVVE
ncbi:MAG: ABC transporter substrate-binding protein [Bauldia sp.]